MSWFVFIVLLGVFALGCAAMALVVTIVPSVFGVLLVGSCLVCVAWLVWVFRPVRAV